MRFLGQEFFDEETVQVTLSILRDLWKVLAILFGLGAIFLFLRLLEVLGYPKSKITFLEDMDFYFTVAVLVVTFWLFMGKLLSRGSSK